MNRQHVDRRDVSSRRPGCAGGRLVLPIIILLVSFIGYMGTSQTNPVTGESQKVALAIEDEIQLGLQAAPQMAAQHQGAESGADAQIVKSMGQQLVQGSEARRAPYKFEFHLLRDSKTINAFALPGGQIFITRALYNQLETKGQLAGVLGHEIGHVIERHSAQQMAKQNLLSGMVAAVASGSDNPQSSAQIAGMIGNFVNMKYGRDDELESDQWGVKILVDNGYDPRALQGVMRILESAGGGSGQPEFASTHPSPGNRIAKIQALIDKQFPNGVPSNLTP